MVLLRRLMTPHQDFVLFERSPSVRSTPSLSNTQAVTGQHRRHSSNLPSASSLQNQRVAAIIQSTGHSISTSAHTNQFNHAQSPQQFYASSAPSSTTALQPTLPHVAEDELNRMQQMSANRSESPSDAKIKSWETEEDWGQLSGIKPPTTLDIQQQKLDRAGHRRGLMLKTRANKMCFSYTISADLSGDRRRRILSRLSERTRDSGEVSLKAIGSYGDRLGLRSRRSVFTGNVKEDVEDSDSAPALPIIPLRSPSRDLLLWHGGAKIVSSPQAGENNLVSKVGYLERPLYSPSMTFPNRNTQSPTTSEGLPPPPYDISLPPFPTAMSGSSGSPQQIQVSKVSSWYPSSGSRQRLTYPHSFNRENRDEPQDYTSRVPRRRPAKMIPLCFNIPLGSVLYPHRLTQVQVPRFLIFCHHLQLVGCHPRLTMAR